MAQAKQSNVKDTRARILLVDDHAVVRYGIAQLINRQTDMVVCGEEEDASRAMSAISTLKPALVIADISLKDSSGLELMRNIKAQYPGLPVLVAMSAAVRCPASASRTASVTSAPALASARAVSTPMPDEPPVTIARLPESSMPSITSAAAEANPKRVWIRVEVVAFIFIVLHRE